MSSIFGWDLPPGVTSSMLPGNQPEGPCEVCGLPVDDCICPECPECGCQGDPECYDKHGLVLTEEQKASKAKADKEAKEADERMCEEESRFYEKCGYGQHMEEEMEGHT